MNSMAKTCCRERSIMSQGAPHILQEVSANNIKRREAYAKLGWQFPQL